MSETWYVMEDGSVGDPREIKAGKDGKLVHKDGRKVAYAPHGPRSRYIENPASAKRKPFGGKGDHDGDGKTGGAAAPKPEAPVGDAKDVKPEKPARGYKTRESKAAD